MIETLERFLQCEWSAFCPGESPPRRIRIALLSSSRELAGTRVLLAFADNRTTPTVVARIPRHPGGAQRLEQEWRVLQHVWESLPASVQPLVPEPLCMTTVRSMPVFIQRALPGRNLKTGIQRGSRPVARRQLEKDLAVMEHWLTAFQRASIRGHGSAKVDVDVRPRFAVCLRKARHVLEGAQLLTPGQGARLIERAEALDAAFEKQSSCWVHGDFWPGNVVEHGKRWGVIDWDDVSIGPSWIDRMWFALHLAALYYARRTREPDLRIALERVLFSTHPFTRTVRKYLEAVFSSVPGVTHRDALIVLLSCHAADVVSGRATRRVFALAASDLLMEWLSGWKPIAL